MVMDVWPWICELPNSEEWSKSSSLVFQLATSKPNSISYANSTHSIQLRAERTFASGSEALVTFSVCSVIFHSSNTEELQSTHWVSETCHLSSDKPFSPLILQLLQESISRSPSGHYSNCPRLQLQKLNPEPISWILDSHSPESFSILFNLIFLSRLFWICVCDAPSEVGSLYFHSLLAPNLETFSCKHAPVLRTFFVSVGTDVELCFMRTFGYMLAKWLILKEVTQVGVGLKALTSLYPSHNLGFSYATESHGLWILKGYSPVKAMNCLWSDAQKNQFPVIEVKESVLRYALAHQQLEAVIQLEYTVGFYDGFIQVRARLDNIRLHVIKLGFKNKDDDDDDDFMGERHFPSRVKIWVGPEVGANYVAGLSLRRSMDNKEREVEVQKIMKGSSGELKVPRVKAMAITATKAKMKNWKWDQDAEGNAAIFSTILCDNITGTQVASRKPSISGGGGGSGSGCQLANNFRRSRAFTKSGGLVFAGEECGDGLGWRLSKEMEGSVLKWRIGGQVWLSYWPNDVNSSQSETRCVEWCDEVDLPLIRGKYS